MTLFCPEGVLEWVLLLVTVPGAYFQALNSCYFVSCGGCAHCRFESCCLNTDEDMLTLGFLGTRQWGRGWRDPLILSGQRWHFWPGLCHGPWWGLDVPLRSQHPWPPLVRCEVSSSAATQGPGPTRSCREVWSSLPRVLGGVDTEHACEWAFYQGVKLAQWWWGAARGLALGLLTVWCVGD